MENSEYVKSGKAAYLVAVLFIIMMVLFSGCDYNYAPRGKFVVNQVVQNYVAPFNCNYHVRLGDLVFTDTCGKWNIGDTIKIVW